MEQFLKHISFFLLYLPALVYACQLAYFTGLCEPLNILISSLGMNYTEVLFSIVSISPIFALKNDQNYWLIY